MDSKDVMEEETLAIEHRPKNPANQSTLSLESHIKEQRVASDVSELVRQAVVEGLSHFGGKNVVESLLYILELEHSVDLKNLANELSSFRLGIYKMFGEASYVIEEKVCNNLASKLGLDPAGRSLEELINCAKESVPRVLSI